MTFKTNRLSLLALGNWHTKLPEKAQDRNQSATPALPLIANIALGIFMNFLKCKESIIQTLSLRGILFYIWVGTRPAIQTH